MLQRAHTLVHIRPLHCLLLIVLMSCSSAQAASATEALPKTEQQHIAAFANLPVFSHPILSPMGDKIAFRTVHKGERIVATRTLGPDGKTFNGQLSAVKTGNFSIASFLWANNERLVVRVRTHYTTWDDTYNGYLLIAVNYDGSDPLRLPMEPEPYTKRWDLVNVYLRYPLVIEPLWWDNKHVLAELDMEPIIPGATFFNLPRVHKVNIYTGKKKLVQKNKKRILHWVGDADGNVRAGVSYDLAGGQRNVRMYYKAPNKKQLKLVEKAKFHDKNRDYPYRIPHENKDIILVSNYRMSNAGEYRDIEDNLFEYDPQKKSTTGRYVNAFRKQTLDDAKARFSDYQVDFISADRDETKAIVAVYSDAEPPTYFIYYGHTRELQFLSQSITGMENFTLGKTTQLEYPARDKTTIPAYLTMPTTISNSKPGLIVLPHDGPEYRDWWGFRSDVQFYASMGYAVFQPQYRGSTGFGIDHMDAGLGQWGMRMQHDVTDGVKWMIDSGKIDKDRICIIGTGYAGYVAALELARHAELYRCGVSIDGILNLKRWVRNLVWNPFWSIDEVLASGYDDVKMHTPTDQTDTIQDPLLIIANQKNAYTELEDSKIMYKRMKQKKKSVTYIEIADAEYYPTHNSHQLKKFAAIKAFLDEHMSAANR